MSAQNAALREKLLREGAGSLAEREALELLVCLTHPKSEAAALAKRALDIHGCVAAAADAGYAGLSEVLPERAALALALLPRLSQIYLLEKHGPGECLDGSLKAAEFMRPYFLHSEYEEVYAAMLDSRSRATACENLTDSHRVTAARIDSRKVVEAALRHRAAAVIIAHNRLNGAALPSPDDKFVTKKLGALLKGANIELRDHIIIAGKDYYSLRDGGFFD
ncbi:MAG: JAB domain-containing protein [Oscillospiraceae bacterium]|nr:JAB domain-containing protein [Oscillospiraceae bacterium]